MLVRRYSLVQAHVSESVRETLWIAQHRVPRLLSGTASCSIHLMGGPKMMLLHTSAPHPVTPRTSHDIPPTRLASSLVVVKPYLCAFLRCTPSSAAPLCDSLEQASFKTFNHHPNCSGHDSQKKEIARTRRCLTPLTGDDV